MANNINVLGDNFNSLVSEYQNTYNQFINTIQKNANSDVKTMNIIDNSAFTGEQILDTIENSSINNCLTSCETTQNCSGATFNNEQDICILNQGKGNIIQSQNHTAIIKEALYHSYKLQKINEQLKNTNEKMMELTNQKIEQHNERNNDKLINSHILQTNYNALGEDKIKIEQIIREYETLNSAYENGNIYVTSNYYYYILFMIIAIILTIIMFSFSFSTGQKGGGKGIKPKLFGVIFGIFAMYILYNTTK